ncbi:MAG: homocysteine S-methyltransferase family protein [Oscillospiraceae bacterium]|nr:homocysteine S-methyltransferase family protein [Oscillospiraceae bacterium]
MKDVTLLDGAMGTMLQAAGLGLGDRPEVWGMQHPEVVQKIHSSYIQSGSHVIYSNTFCANAHKLAGTGFSVEEAVTANVKIAKAAAQSKPVRVALDIGPIGELMEPLGNLSFEEAYRIFAQMICAGASAGADLVIFETFTDLYELKAGILAAAENCSLPIWATMSFEASGRTFAGTTVESAAMALNTLPVEAFGINCSLGPDEILPMLQKMRSWTNKPLIAKPNAGLPSPETGEYAMKAPEFGRIMQQFADCGIYIMGGCCGTTPEYIAELTRIPHAAAIEPQPLKSGICAPGCPVSLDGVRVIGERINPTGKKRFQQALRENDLDYIINQAVEQADAGADILDINVGLPGIDEPAMMAQVVKAVQGMVSLPLQIDSSVPEAIEAGLRVCSGKAIVNSVNAEDEVLDRILPLVKKYGAAVVGLTMDKNGIPDTAEKRFALADKILQAALRHGIPREDVYIDCLTLTVSAQQDQAAETLKAVKMVRNILGLHCVLGVSNISFGLPERQHITTSFLTQAMYCGLDLPIVNPNQKAIMDAVYAFRVLNGQDRDCAAYIERFAQGSVPAAAVQPKEMSIETAVLKGLKKETADLTAAKLQQFSPLDVVNRFLIPALDKVGMEYEKNHIFIPQLINAANAACAGFDLVKEKIAAAGEKTISRGTIIMATVEGDIHDIGKNIVNVVLENYGYTVIDLGRDVPVKTVVEAVIRENAKLVGLSALMTTTVDSMRRTIQAIRESGHECKIMVGGAVLTYEYAMEIGADYYTRDAKESAEVAREVFGL